MEMDMEKLKNRFREPNKFVDIVSTLSNWKTSLEEKVIH